MIGIPAHVVQIVVLAGNAHTFLRVGGAGVRSGAGVQENVLELVHTGVGEKKRGIINRRQTGTGHDCVTPLGEKIEKALAHLGARHFLQWHILLLINGINGELL